MDFDLNAIYEFVSQTVLWASAGALLVNRVSGEASKTLRVLSGILNVIAINSKANK